MLKKKKKMLIHCFIFREKVSVRLIVELNFKYYL